MGFGSPRSPQWQHRKVVIMSQLTSKMPPAGHFRLAESGQRPVKEGDLDFPLLDNPPLETTKHRGKGTQMEPSEAGPFGRGGARERTEFSPPGGNGGERTLRRRWPLFLWISKTVSFSAREKEMGFGSPRPPRRQHQKDIPVHSMTDAPAPHGEPPARRERPAHIFESW